MINWTNIAGIVRRGPLPLGEYIRELKGAGVEVHLYRGQQGRWIAMGLDGKLYDFPAECGGWEQRRPYAGTPPESSRVAAMMALGTGWPIVDREALAKALPE